MSLSERLRDRIAREGPISFADFMGAALQDPEEGYYARGAAIGEGGDFLTSPHVTPAFAAAFARLFSIDAEAMPGAVDFVEVGAGDGRFLEDFIAALGRMDPGLHARLRVTAVEASAGARRILASRGILPQPRVLTSVDELPASSVSGWIFSNELYDALPVIRVVGSEDGLREMRVDARGEDFVWSLAPADPALVQHLQGFGVTLAPGQQGEIAPLAETLQTRLAEALARGWIVTVDYGHPARVLYHPFARPNGTLAVHRSGRRGGDPLSQPGRAGSDRARELGRAHSRGRGRGPAHGSHRAPGHLSDRGGNLRLRAKRRGEVANLSPRGPRGMGEEISVLVQSRGVTHASATA